MIKRRLAIGAMLLAILVFGLLLGLFLPRWAGISMGPKAFNPAVVIQQVQTLSQLVTVKYVMEKVVILEDVKWFAGWGENRVLMVAHGTVKAGLDFAGLKPEDLRISGK